MSRDGKPHLNTKRLMTTVLLSISIINPNPVFFNRFKMPSLLLNAIFLVIALLHIECDAMCKYCKLFTKYFLRRTHKLFQNLKKSVKNFSLSPEKLMYSWLVSLEL